MKIRVKTVTGEKMWVEQEVIFPKSHSAVYYREICDRQQRHLAALATELRAAMSIIDGGEPHDTWKCTLCGEDLCWKLIDDIRVPVDADGTPHNWTNCKHGQTLDSLDIRAPSGNKL